MKKYTEQFEEDEDSWRYHEVTSVVDETGKVLFSVSVCSDSPEDHTFYRDLSDCRNVADLLNEAYEQGLKDGRSGVAGTQAQEKQ